MEATAYAGGAWDSDFGKNDTFPADRQIDLAIRLREENGVGTLAGMDAVKELPIFEATTADFDALVFEVRDQLVIVDFWGQGCASCDAFASDAPALLAKLPQDGVRVVKVNAYEYPELARRFSLVGIPTFLLVRDGRVLGKMSEYYGRDHWLGVIEDHLPGGPQFESLQKNA